MAIKLSLLAAASLMAYLPTGNGLATEMSGATYLQYAAATYNIVDTYDSSNFFSEFTLFSGADPTGGFVNYQGDQSSASSAGLINTNNGQIYMGVDYTNVVSTSSAGRPSIRVSSNKGYTHGLFIADIAHMPGSICGTWPAFWMFGPSWPNNGEIDIIEGVNVDSTNDITLHTSAGCDINIAGSQSGTTLSNSDCNTGSGGTGCGVTTTTSNAYGTSFNNNGGGVYAMQWESSGVYVWFWPHGSVPSDVTAGQPVTGNWGLPIVAFNGGSGCDIDAHFSDQNIVFDTTFCGQWAGAVWGDSCSNLADTCIDYVAGNPGAFQQSYWSVNSVKVYQQ